MTSTTSLLLRPSNLHRSFSAYAFGTQWTGALSRPSSSTKDDDEAPELTAAELLAGQVQNLVEMELPLPSCATTGGGGDDDNAVVGAEYKCMAASAGWGHSALVLQRRQQQSQQQQQHTNDNNNNTRNQLFLCGRPHDFQTLLRLRRLPAPLRNLSLSIINNNNDSSNRNNNSKSSSLLQSIVSYLAGENEATIHEEECRRYSNIQRLIEMELPENQMPALEGEVVDDALLNLHGRRKMLFMDDNDDDNDDNTTRPHHNTFQNTLATSAGLTAVISNTGKLYTFGLNHRGQCGVGTFSPNVWMPTPVLGLASLRFLLDYNHFIATTSGSSSGSTRNNDVSSGSHIYKECPFQEYPIVSVHLGLQHGIALDCMGQVFTWGKGERGQLGHGKRYLYESLQEEQQQHEMFDVEQYKKDKSEYIFEEEEPNENKTLEYAMQITNFYDPYATLSMKAQDVYAPLLSEGDSKVRLIGAGMNFCMAVTESNLPYIWGKNCIHNPNYDDSSSRMGIMNNHLHRKPVLDSTYPRYIKGLPCNNVQIIKVACGTHHASLLLEDGSVYAVGVATDQPVPMWNEAVEILPPHVVDVSNLISFSAGFDRTFVVYGDEFGKRQVIEIQLWGQEEMRMNGSVRPSWCDWLEDVEGGVGGKKKMVKSVHRGWMHTVILTEEG